jgi:propanediol dehydratase small subunit
MPDYPLPDYPLAEHAVHSLRSPRGVALKDITLGGVLHGDVTMDDLRITRPALEAQARIAAEAGRVQLADNLLRAGELVAVPDDVILSIYNALRPGRSTAAELARLADLLDREYDAHRCAALVRESAGGS